MTYDYEEHRNHVSSQYEAWRRKQPKCMCRHKHKITVALHNGEIEILGAPEGSHFDLTVINLDKELGDE